MGDVVFCMAAMKRLWERSGERVDVFLNDFHLTPAAVAALEPVAAVHSLSQPGCWRASRQSPASKGQGHDAEGCGLAREPIGTGPRLSGGGWCRQNGVTSNATDCSRLEYKHLPKKDHRPSGPQEKPSERPPPLFGFEDDGYHNFQSDEHWTEVLKRCLKFDDSIDVRPLIKRRIDNLLDDVEGWIHQLAEDDKMNFVPVLADRFAKVTHVFCCCPTVSKSRIGPAGAFNIYLAVLDAEERLLDIADKQERYKEFHRLVGEHQFQPDVISSLDLDAYREIAAHRQLGCGERGWRNRHHFFGNFAGPVEQPLRLWIVCHC
jgi:hypothetical protein